MIFYIIYSMAILGIDEVGRGPWAGPLVIGAVVLPDRFDAKSNPIDSESWQDNLTDSKKLTAKKCEKLSPIILEKSTATGLGWVSAAELDKIGLSAALNLAAKRAVAKIPTNSFSEIIIDGTQNFLKGTDLEGLVSVLPKADSKIKEVSAASIIAKVARDNYMIKLSKKYPEYGFDFHVGYGTKKHQAALAEFGPCPEHRYSFRPVAASVADQPAPNPSSSQTTTMLGQRAEQKVAKHLEHLGHKILAKNYKTKYYEIDIISATKDHIYFTEVKYRKNSTHGEPLEFIDQRKQKQMVFATESFMEHLSRKLNRKQSTLPSPILAAASVSGKDFHLDKWFTLE